MPIGAPTRVLTPLQAAGLRVYLDTGRTGDDKWVRLPGVSNVARADNQRTTSQIQALDELATIAGVAEIGDITIDLAAVQFGHDEIATLIQAKSNENFVNVRVESRGREIFAATSGDATAAVDSKGKVTLSDKAGHHPFEKVGQGMELRIGSAAAIIRTNNEFISDQTPTNPNASNSTGPKRSVTVGLNNNFRLPSPAAAVSAGVYGIRVPIYRWDNIVASVTGGGGWQGGVDGALAGNLILTPGSETGLPKISLTQTQPYEA